MGLLIKGLSALYL